MSEVVSETPLEVRPDMPAGAYQVFLGLAAVGFLAMVGCFMGYGYYGDRITQGLDRACAEASLDAARKLEAAGNTDQAIRKYRQALEGHISDPQERYRCGLAIGDILFRQQDYNEALEAYRVLPKEAFATAGAYAGYVGTLWQLGAVDEAVKAAGPWLERAMEEANVEQEVWARKILMRAADRNGDTQSVLEQSRKIVNLDPGDDAALKLAALLLEQGDRVGARRQAQALMEATENPVIRNSARAFLKKLEGQTASPDPS